MPVLTKKQQAGLCHGYGKKAYAITGKRTKVRFEDGAPFIGAASAGGEIFLGAAERYTGGMSLGEAVSFHNGVFAHEAMHLVMTDFPAFEAHTNRLKKGEAFIFHTIHNILEDSAIEYFMPEYIGGRLLTDMGFMRARVYEKSPPIDGGETKDAYSQYISAFIQYGDAGVIKGSFTFPEARDAFVATVSLWEQGLMEKDALRRIKTAGRIFRATEHLWRATADDIGKQQELAEAMNAYGKNKAPQRGGGAGGSPLSQPQGGAGNGGAREKRRKATAARIAGEEDGGQGQNQNNSREAGGGMPDGEADKDGKTPGGEEKEAGGTHGSKGASMEDGEENGKGADAPYSGSKPGGGESDSGQHGGGDAESGDAPGNGNGANEGAAESADGEPTPEDEGLLSREDAEAALSELEELVREQSRISSEAKESENAPADIELPYGGLKGCCRNVRCRHTPVRAGSGASDELKAAYARFAYPLMPQVRMLTSQLRREFRNAQEEKVRKTSGKVSVGRLSRGGASARVFDRRKAPSDRHDMAVAIACDESGSTQGSVIMGIKAAAIGLAETFAALRIPLYVMGFTYRENRRQPEHFHYIRWHNTPESRAKLLSMNSRETNFDSYAIRYAAELLKKRPERNKLLIVISDGIPSAGHYALPGGSTRQNGIADTKQAVKESNRHATTMGILLGDASPEQHREMYGVNFFHIKDPGELFTKMSKFVAKLIKGW